MRVFFLSVILLVIVGSPHPLDAQNRKAMWVWDTESIIGITDEENILINECMATGITDLYLYITNNVVVVANGKIKTRAFIKKASCNNVRVWGMDGWRGYFSDLCGPSGFYNNIQKIIDFNAAGQIDEKFMGFHGDNEFQVWDNSTGCGAADVFHYGLRDDQLSTVSGGVWKTTEKMDRDSLMSDFVKQTKTAAVKCHNSGLQYSISVMPWITAVNWTHNAIGNQNTPLYAIYNGVNKELYKHLMDYVDEYVIMSYHTNVQSKVTLMCEDELSYADGIAAEIRPRIMSGLETHCGVSQYVSYCDTPGEDTKAHVKNDEMPAHISLLGVHPSYSGIGIHDWVGWKGLSVVSSNTSDPPNSCSVASVTHSNLKPGLSVLIYPNPVESDIFIKVESSDEIGFKIMDAQGKEILLSDRVKKRSSGEFLLNAEGLPEGIYLIYVTDGIKESIVKITKK